MSGTASFLKNLNGNLVGYRRPPELHGPNHVPIGLRKALTVGTQPRAMLHKIHRFSSVKQKLGLQHLGSNLSTGIFTFYFRLKKKKKRWHSNAARSWSQKTLIEKNKHVSSLVSHNRDSDDKTSVGYQGQRRPLPHGHPTATRSSVCNWAFLNTPPPPATRHLLISGGTKRKTITLLCHSQTLSLSQWQ